MTREEEWKELYGKLGKRFTDGEINWVKFINEREKIRKKLGYD